MSEEEKKGKALELNIKDTVGVSEKASLTEAGITKEQFEKLKKSMIVFLLDYQRTEKSAQDIVKKMGFKHLAVAQQTVIDTIDIYLKQYRTEQEARKNAK